jgi:hypothetical protein
MRLILSLLFVCGIAIIVNTAVQSYRVSMLWADFCIYERKLLAPDSGKSATQPAPVELKQLTERLWQFNDSKVGIEIGCAVSVLSATGFILLSRQNKNQRRITQASSAVHSGIKPSDHV